ncbi:MAG: ABC transporter substrate-binding protein [Jatrophihabitans sp.]
MTFHSHSRRPLAALVALPLLLGLAVACSSNSAAQQDQGPASKVRVGYFANVTHAVPVLGVADGEFQKELGKTKLDTEIFNAGPAEVEALLSGAIDVAYLGPSPAINAFQKTHGEAVRLIAGGASGGASLVVKPNITSIADLKGKTVASPQFGNTQDVALRAFLAAHRLKTDTTGGKDVTVLAQDNAQTLDLFRQGQVDGGWLPEPWASRLVVEAGAKTLVDERTLWPGGKFVTTNLLVSKKFLDQHPDTVEAILRAHVATVDKITGDTAWAKATLNAELKKLTGKPLSDAVLTPALANLTVGWDPYAATLKESAEHAVTAGTAKSVPDLKGIYALTLLNKVLQAAGKQPVSADGLDGGGNGT